MAKTWKTNLNTPFFTLFIISYLMFGILSTSVEMPIWILYIAGPLLVIFLIYFFFIRLQRLPTWSSHYRTLEAKSVDPMGPLETELREANLGPSTKKGEASHGTSWWVLDLNNGLNVTVTKKNGSFTISVGPIRSDNRNDITHVEQMIDRTLEGMEARPPSRP